jgi:DNA-binding beta-propeller fold protein YncE
MWINSRVDNALVRKIDVATGAVVATVPVYPGIHNSAFDGAYLWAACGDSGVVAKIDVNTNQVAEVVGLPAGSCASDIWFDGKDMWVSDPGNGGFVRKLQAK